MKKKLLNIICSLVIIFSFITFTASSQGNQWTWVKGDNIQNQDAIYGTQGVPDASNKPGGRGGNVSWRDASGNLWLFGGFGFSANGLTFGYGLLNDLWKFDVTTTQWTWVKGDHIRNQDGIYGEQGVAFASNKPGARDASVSWTDALGNLWLFGGNGISGGRLNDLWKFNITTTEWTWVKGDSIPDQPGIYGVQGDAAVLNKPRARDHSVSWTDASGNLWLFGGFGYTPGAPGGDIGDLNDLWKFDVTTTEWTWVKGDSVPNQEGIYGTQGVADASNKPGAREGSVSWTDASGNLWLFGGYGYTASDLGFLNDLWKFDVTTTQWTWVKGDTIINRKGIYGTQGAEGASNKPGARLWSGSWTDALGNLWLFGGQSLGDSYLNDLWKFDITSSRWTWVKGDKIPNQEAIYGTQGAANASNKPGARSNCLSWTDTFGNLWLFGGAGFTENGSGAYLNDLWKFDVTTPFITITAPANNTTIVGPVDITFTAIASNPNGTINKVEFYNGTKLMATEKYLKYSWTWKSSPVGKHKVTAKAYDNNGLVTVSAPVHVTVVPVNPSTVSIVYPLNNATYKSPADVRITAVASTSDGAISKVEFYNGTTLLATERSLPYSWNWVNAPVGMHTLTAKAYYTSGPVRISDPVTITVNSPSATLNRPAFAATKSDINSAVTLKLMPNPANNILNIYTTGLKNNKQATLSVISVSGALLKTKKLNGLTGNIQLNVSSLASGTYTLKLISGDKIIYKKFVKL